MVYSVGDSSCLIKKSTCIESRVIQLAKIARERFSSERPGVVHVWGHSAHGLRWSDEDRRVIIVQKQLRKLWDD